MTLTATLKVTCNYCSKEIEFTLSEIEREYVRLLIENQDWFQEESDIHMCPRCRADDLRDCPPDIRPIVEHRLWVIRPLLEIDKQIRTHTAFEERAYEVQKELARRGVSTKKRSPTTSVSVRTIYRWIKAYEESNYDWQSLVTSYENSGAKGVARVEPDVDRIMRELIKEYLSSGKKRSLRELWNELGRRIEDRNSSLEKIYWVRVPERSTLYRRLREYSPVKKHPITWNAQANQSTHKSLH